MAVNMGLPGAYPVADPHAIERISMLITLTNGSHETSTKIRVIDGRVSHRAGLNAWKNLCGGDNCSCRGILGQRGVQRYKQAVIQIKPDFENGGNRPGNHSACVRVLT